MTAGRTRGIASPFRRSVAALDAFCDMMAAEQPLMLLLICSMAAACIF